MRHLPEKKKDPNLLVGVETSDDAGVYRLTDELAMIQTVDFFTPIVDDPYTFGQIAASNSLSDVYAMGGVPKTVLNIVGFPIKKLAPEILTEILKGAADKVEEAGAVIAGGHSIDDQEPKFGLSVTGLVHPEKYYTNIGAKPGDSIVLTKPIGVGIHTTAIKPEKLSPQRLKAVSETMAELNKVAAEELSHFTPHAVTDVTGFGLLGHSYEMATGSNVSIHIDFNSVPILEGTQELAEKGFVPGGSKANHRWIDNSVQYDNLTEIEQFILCDAVTSGGLLISLPDDEATAYVERMKQKGKTATKIGTVTEKQFVALYASKHQKP